MSQEALRRLMAYHWPGNVRQLENVVERAIAFSQGRPQVDVQDLTPEVQLAGAGTRRQADVLFPTKASTSSSYISGVELSLIKQSLERTHGNKRQAAKLLNLKRTTLIEKLKRLEPRQQSEADALTRDARDIQHASTPYLLDDHSRGQADGVPRAHAGGAAADAEAAAGEASRRGA